MTPSTSPIRCLILALPIAAVGLVLPVDSPEAIPVHGSLEIPMSRGYHCYREGPQRPTSSACLEALAVAGPQQFYDWNEVNLLNVDGRHRESIPDGELCSAGREKYRGLDLAREDWPAQILTPDADGTFEFVYRATAPHSTLRFSFYITRDGYDPKHPLRWSDLEEEPFCTISDPVLNIQRYHLRCPLPEGKSGRHLIYNIWERDDSPEAFYACSDVVFADPDRDPGASPQLEAPAEPASPHGESAKEARGHTWAAAPWSPASVYVNGDRVTHDGRSWKAQWWTRDEEPGTTGEWGVWQEEEEYRAH